MANYDTSVRVGTDVDNSDLAQLEKQFDRLEKKMDSLRKKGEKMEALGVDKQSKQWKAWQFDVARVEGDMYEVQEAIHSVISDTPQGFSKLRSAAASFFGAIKVGGKESNGLFKTMMSRLKGIALSLLIFNWITKGFNAMVSALKAGFQNLAQYSKDYNAAMSDLKSECAQVKNSLAVAFEPIVTAIIPYITQLISWLNIAADKMTQFLAAIQGKSTYTKAKKQVVDYAKTLKTAGESAQGALAAFDSINVLSKNEKAGGVSAGGEVTGAAAFEEAEVNPEIYIMLEKIKTILEAIYPWAIAIGVAFLAWKIGTILDDLGAMLRHGKHLYGIIMFIAGVVLSVYEYFRMWKDGVDWEGIIGFISGVALAVGGLYLLFGPLAAGIALIVAGVAGLILAFKDITENGANAKNITLLLISAVGLLAGVFIAFGGPAAAVVAAVMAVIGVLAGMIAIAGNGGEALDTLKSFCGNFADFFKKIFAGDVEGALESLKAAGKDFANIFIITFESLINCLIKGLNWLIEKINSISFDVPDWVPAIGGKTLSLNIPTVKEVDLPRLATGGIVNSPTRALIGEAGREAVLPLENNTGWMDDLADRIASRMPTGSNGPIYADLILDGQKFARLEMPYLKQENSRIGVSFKMAGGTL